MAKRKKIILDTKQRSAADRYEIMPYTTDMTSETMTLEGKQYAWGRQGAVHVKDGAEAQALQDKYGDRVITMKVSNPDIHDRGHKYFFTMPGVQWARYDEFGRRVYDGKTESEEAESEEGHAPDAERLDDGRRGHAHDEEAQEKQEERETHARILRE